MLLIIIIIDIFTIIFSMQYIIYFCTLSYRMLSDFISLGANYGVHLCPCCRCELHNNIIITIKIYSVSVYIIISYTRSILL